MDIDNDMDMDMHVDKDLKMAVEMDDFELENQTVSPLKVIHRSQYCKLPQSYISL
jgi:hypothetical protein